MNLLERLLGHDAWTTRRLLDLCASLGDVKLDREFDIGHRTLRDTFHHIIRNMEVWSSLMAGEKYVKQSDCSIKGMIERLEIAASRLAEVSQPIAASNAWDKHWIDYFDDPPSEKSYGSGIAHIITHSMHHRAQLLYLMRKTGIENLPEGDVFSWENRDQLSLD